MIGATSRRKFAGTKSKLVQIGVQGKHILGAMLVAVGVSILTGWDKGLETWLVEHSPAWLTELTTRF